MKVILKQVFVIGLSVLRKVSIVMFTVGYLHVVCVTVATLVSASSVPPHQDPYKDRHEGEDWGLHLKIKKRIHILALKEIESKNRLNR